MDRGTVVLLHGLIKWEDSEADCEVLARMLAIPSRNSADAMRVFTYTDCSVIGAPAGIPDGEYTVEFAGFSFTATKQRDMWLTSGPAFKIPDMPPMVEI